MPRVFCIIKKSSDARTGMTSLHSVDARPSLQRTLSLIETHHLSSSSSLVTSRTRAFSSASSEPLLRLSTRSSSSSSSPFVDYKDLDFIIENMFINTPRVLDNILFSISAVYEGIAGDRRFEGILERFRLLKDNLQQSCFSLKSKKTRGIEIFKGIDPCKTSLLLNENITFLQQAEHDLKDIDINKMRSDYQILLQEQETARAVYQNTLRIYFEQANLSHRVIFGPYHNEYLKIMGNIEHSHCFIRELQNRAKNYTECNIARSLLTSPSINTILSGRDSLGNRNETVANLKALCTELKEVDLRLFVNFQPMFEDIRVLISEIEDTIDRLEHAQEDFRPLNISFSDFALTGSPTSHSPLSGGPLSDFPASELPLPGTVFDVTTSSSSRAVYSTAHEQDLTDDGALSFDERREVTDLIGKHKTLFNEKFRRYHESFLMKLFQDANEKILSIKVDDHSAKRLESQMPETEFTLRNLLRDLEQRNERLKYLEKMLYLENETKLIQQWQWRTCENHKVKKCGVFQDLCDFFEKYETQFPKHIDTESHEYWSQYLWPEDLIDTLQSAHTLISNFVFDTLRNLVEVFNHVKRIYDETRFRSRSRHEQILRTQRDHNVQILNLLIETCVEFSNEIERCKSYTNYILFADSNEYEYPDSRCQLFVVAESNSSIDARTKFQVNISKDNYVDIRFHDLCLKYLNFLSVRGINQCPRVQILNINQDDLEDIPSKLGQIFQPSLEGTPITLTQIIFVIDQIYFVGGCLRRFDENNAKLVLFETKKPSILRQPFRDHLNRLCSENGVRLDAQFGNVQSVGRNGSFLVLEAIAFLSRIDLPESEFTSHNLGGYINHIIQMKYAIEQDLEREQTQSDVSGTSSNSAKRIVNYLERLDKFSRVVIDAKFGFRSRWGKFAQSALSDHHFVFEYRMKMNTVFPIETVFVSSGIDRILRSKGSTFEGRCFPLLPLRSGLSSASFSTSTSSSSSSSSPVFGSFTSSPSSRLGFALPCDSPRPNLAEKLDWFSSAASCATGSSSAPSAGSALGVHVRPWQLFQPNLDGSFPTYGKYPAPETPPRLRAKSSVSHLLLPGVFSTSGSSPSSLLSRRSSDASTQPSFTPVVPTSVSSIPSLDSIARSSPLQQQTQACCRCSDRGHAQSWMRSMMHHCTCSCHLTKGKKTRHS